MLDPRPVSESDDKKLVLSFQTGGSGAYREIYERYEPRVRGVCKRMLACPEDVEEACQETFLRVYQGLSRFNGRYQLGAWVCRIATNVCLDMLRAKKRRPSDPRKVEDLEQEAATPQTAGDPEWSAMQRVNVEAVRSILDSLPEMHRAAIVLRDYDGLSYVDIATKLSISEKQTKALLHRARKNFRRSWTGGTLAGLLLPGGFLSKLTRLRRVPRLEEASARSGGFVSDMVGSMGNVAASCGTMVQQCGQIAAERFAGSAMAIVMGTAAIGAPAIAHSIGERQQHETRSVAAEAPPVGESGATSPAAAASTLRKKNSLRDLPPEESEEQAQEAAAPPPAPAPSPEPTPTPAPTTQPTPPANGAGGTSPPADGGGKPKDTSSPPPVTPSTPPQVRAWFDSTTWPAAVASSSYRGSVDCAGLVVQQEFQTEIVDHDGRHPAFIALRSGTNPTISMTVNKREEEVTYNGGAPTQSWKRTGNAIELSFSGSYGLLGNGNPESVNLPRSGRFDVRLVLDCAAPRVVTEDITFHL